MTSTISAIVTAHEGAVRDDAAVVISISGILMPGETELPDERLRRATWVLSRDDETWTVAAYTNCPTNPS